MQLCNGLRLQNVRVPLGTLPHRKKPLGTALHKLIYRAPSSASAADDITAFIICATVNTAPLLVGYASSSDMKKCPPDLLLALRSDRYDASLCTANTMSLAL